MRKKHHLAVQWERNPTFIFFSLSFCFLVRKPPPFNLIVIHPFHNFSPFLNRLFFLRLTCIIGQNPSMTLPVPALLILPLLLHPLDPLSHTFTSFFFLPSGTPALFAPSFELPLFVGSQRTSRHLFLQGLLD